MWNVLRKYPWLWILLGFLIYVFIWFAFIRFAGDHRPPPFDPENPPERVWPEG